MKTTVNVSIGRIAFHIDSDAYRLLKKYLDRLERHFANKESGKEIVADIEERLSELLSARLPQPRKVVTLAMVEEVIAIMGMPDDMEEGSSAEASTSPSVSAVSQEPRQKRMYRDMERKIVGGVCSGLAAYFNTDKVFVRLAFIILFFAPFPFHHAMSGTALFVYIALWIAIPAAHTGKEKLEMRGNHKPTIADIEKKVLEEAEGEQDNWLVRLIKIFARIVIVFIGIILLIVALSGFLIIPALFLVDIAPNITVFGLFNYINIGMNIFWFKLLFTLALFLPFMGLLYIAVKALLGFKGRYRTGVFIFLLWLVSVIGLAIAAMPAIHSYSYWNKVKDEVELDHRHDTLYINIADKYKNLHNQMIFDYRSRNSFSAMWSDETAGKTSLYILPQVEIVRTRDSGAISIAYSRHTAGRNRYMVQEKLELMHPKISLRDSLLTLKPFIFDKKNKWSGETMRVTIYVPQGKAVKSEMLNGYYKEISVRRYRYY